MSARHFMYFAAHRIKQWWQSRRGQPGAGEIALNR